MFDEFDMIDCTLNIYWSNNDGSNLKHGCIEEYSEQQLADVHELCWHAKMFRRISFFAFGDSRNWRLSSKFDELSEQLTSIVRDVHGLPIFDLGTMYDHMEHRDEWHYSNSAHN